VTDTTALEGLRVLELSGLSGAYCGKMFAGLGAQVTLIEPPGGSALRRKSPFVEGLPLSQASLSFAYLAADKDSVVLDLAIAEGRAEFSKHAAEADLLILGDHPDARTLDLAALRQANPRLVITQITPYGASGPYADFLGDDLTLMAMGGLLTMAGTPDAAPVVAYGEQGLLAADQFAAVASLSAILDAEATGVGDLIDVSIQEAIVMALENAAQTYQLEGKVRNRTKGAARAGSGIFPCKDGEIYLLAGGIGETAMWGNFAAWLAADGIERAHLFAADEWVDTAPDAKQVFERIFLPFAASRTKDELYAKGKEWRVPIAPMSTPADLLENRQLIYRGFFTAPENAQGPNAIRMPGAPYKLSQTPWRLRNAAPVLNAETNHAEIVR
jgi:benzylsuccinate CoA-transferase BbsE subunit